MYATLLMAGALVLTSVGAGVVGERYLGLNRSRVPAAFDKLLESLGLSVVFLILNVVIGAAVSFGIRSFTAAFVSAYAVGDVTYVVFSVCQAIAFQWWWFSGERARSLDR
jgi:hypothetical protein